jgi:hypothetical protein
MDRYKTENDVEMLLIVVQHWFMNLLALQEIGPLMGDMPKRTEILTVVERQRQDIAQRVTALLLPPAG